MIKSKLAVLIAFLSLLFIGCTGKEPIYISNFFIINESGRSLDMKIYRKDSIEIHTINQSTTYRKCVMQGFSGFPNPFESADSLVINFEDKKHITYTSQSPDKRQNILWLEAYDVQVLSDKTGEYANNYTYRITEQQYLSAK